MTNEIKICGVVKSFGLLREIHGTKIYGGTLKVERDSGNFDSLPFETTKYMDLFEKNINNYVFITGEFRTYSLEKTKKQVIFVKNVKLEGCISYNEVTLEGPIVGKKELRTTPKGRTIIDFTIAVNMGNHISYYPILIAWGKCAESINDLKIGTEIKVHSRFQSREYYKKLEDGNKEVHTVYELSVYDMEVVPKV